MQRSLVLMLAVGGLVAGLTGLPASPWGMPAPTAAATGTPSDVTIGAARAGVVGARIGIHPDKTRFVLEVSERVTFHISVLDGPRRVIVELPDVSWPGGEVVKPGRGAIRSYHAERSPNGSLRVVLEVAEQVRLGSAFVMPASEGYKPRLVFDLEPPTAALIEADKARERAAASARPTPYPGTAPVAMTPPIAGSQLSSLPPPAQEERTAMVPASLQPSAAAVSPPIPLVVAAALRPPPPPQFAPPQPAPPQFTPAQPAPAQIAPPQSAPPQLSPVSLPPPSIKPRRTPSAVKPMVALDPGHGGVDPGATGINGIHEKDITLATAFEVQRQLEAGGHFRVMLTREDDEFVPLRERVARARQAGAELFISLHADSIAKSEIRGLSIYTQSDKGSDHEAETLAAKENRADAIGGIDLSHENDQVATILIDLAQRDTRNHAHRFATMVLRDAGHFVPLLPKPDRSAAFAVLTAPDVPSVLIEMGYLSNATDASLLTQPHHRQRLAGILAHAIEGYFTWRGRRG